jgi:hypothetical protein
LGVVNDAFLSGKFTREKIFSGGHFDHVLSVETTEKVPSSTENVTVKVTKTVAVRMTEIGQQS